MSPTSSVRWKPAHRMPSVSLISSIRNMSAKNTTNLAAATWYPTCARPPHVLFLNQFRMRMHEICLLQAHQQPRQGAHCMRSQCLSHLATRLSDRTCESLTTCSISSYLCTAPRPNQGSFCRQAAGVGPARQEVDGGVEQRREHGLEGQAGQGLGHEEGGVMVQAVAELAPQQRLLPVHDAARVVARLQHQAAGHEPQAGHAVERPRHQLAVQAPVRRACAGSRGVQVSHLAAMRGRLGQLLTTVCSVTQPLQHAVAFGSLASPVQCQVTQETLSQWSQFAPATRSHDREEVCCTWRA